MHAGLQRPEISMGVGSAGRNPAVAWMDALAATAPIELEPCRTLPSVIADLAKRKPDAPALLSDRESYDFAALARRINRYARWTRDRGIAKGETVCLLMPNRPEYAAIWLGIAAAGGATALLNTSLTGASLARSIETSGARHIIVDASLRDALHGAYANLGAYEAPRTWCTGGEASDTDSLDLALASLDDGPLARNWNSTPSASMTGRC